MVTMLNCRSFFKFTFQDFTRFRKAPCRNLWLCSIKFAKLRQETENEHAFSVVEKCFLNGNSIGPRIYKLISPESGNKTADFPIAEDLSSCSKLSINELHESFVLVSSAIKRLGINLEDPKYNSLTENVTKAIPEMTDQQIADILFSLQSWSPTESTETPNFQSMWNTLDTECTSRCSRWNHEHIISIGHLWFYLKLNRITKYNGALIERLQKEINQLNAHLIVQLLFFMNLQRKQIPNDIRTIIENKLLESLDVLTLDELGVAALGFFKTQTSVKSTMLISGIISKMAGHIGEMNELTLAALMKLIRYSAKPEHLDLCTILQKRCILRVDTLQPSTITNILLLIAHHLVCHEELLMKVVRRFSQDIKTLRIKELQKSMHCLSTFMQFNPPNQILSTDYANLIVSELRSPERQQEIVKYPTSFISIMLSLAYIKVYPDDLINQCLDADFIQAAQKISNIDILRDVAVLDTSVGLECPWYNGNRLPAAMTESAFKKFHYNLPSGSHTYNLTKDVQANLMALFRISANDYCHICHILPQFQNPDILLILNSEGKVTKIPNKIIIQQGTIIRPHTEEDRWFAIVLGGRGFYQRESRQVTGISHMKLRQLKTLGYNVIEIPWFIYTNLPKFQREEFIRNKIFTNFYKK